MPAFGTIGGQPGAGPTQAHLNDEVLQPHSLPDAGQIFATEQESPELTLAGQFTAAAHGWFTCAKAPPVHFQIAR